MGTNEYASAGAKKNTILRHRSFVFSVLAALALLATACGSSESSEEGTAGEEAQAPTSPEDASVPEWLDGDEEWDEIVSAARDEGTLQLGLSAGPGYEEYAALLTDELADYIDVEVTFIRAGDFTSRVLSEQEAGEHFWDAYAGPLPGLYDNLTPAGALQDLPPILEDIPDHLRSDEVWGGGFEFFADPDQPQSFVNEVRIGGALFADRDVVGEDFAPEDLLSDDLRNQIVIYDPSTVNAGSLTLTWFMANDEYGEDYLRELLSEQEVVYAGTRREATRWLAEGRYAVGVGTELEHLNELQAEGLGESVELIDDFGLFNSAHGISVLADAPNPNSVRVLLAWFLSQEGQDAWARLTTDDASSRRTDVEVYHPEYTPDYENLEPLLDTTAGTVWGRQTIGKTITITRELVGQ